MISKNKDNPHYKQGKIECIQAIQSALSPEQFEGFLAGNILKYTWRYRHKNQCLSDLQKIAYYTDKLRRFIESQAKQEK